MKIPRWTPIICVLSIASQAAFADPSVLETMPVIPEHGNRIEDFIPPGWKIFTGDSGDLNGDGLEDDAFILVKNDDDPQAGRLDKNFKTTLRPLVVVHRQGSHFVKACVSTGAVMHGELANRFALNTVGLQITNGNIVVQNENGATSSLGFKSKYRLQSGKYELIGFTKFASRIDMNLFSKTDCNLNTGYCEVEDKDGATHNSSYFSQRAGLVVRPPVHLDTFDKEEWPGCRVFIGTDKTKSPHLVSTFHAVHTEKDLYICALIKHPVQKETYAINLFTEGKNIVRPTITNISASSDGMFVYAGFPLKLLAKSISSNKIGFLPNDVKTISADIQVIAERPNKPPHVVLSNFKGSKFNSSEIVLARKAALPSLEDWDWSNPDFPF